MSTVLTGILVFTCDKYLVLKCHTFYVFFICLKSYSTEAYMRYRVIPQIFKKLMRILNPTKTDIIN